MTPTPAELREAAILLRNWFIQSSAFPDDKDEAIYTLATHYLSHFPPDGAEPITADWLREEFGFYEESKSLLMHDKIDGCIRFYHKMHPAWVIDGMLIMELTTRQQFRTLAGLLGIEPKRKGE